MAPTVSLAPEFFARDVHDVARELIGATLLVDSVGGTIVEVEAYHHEDPAAHGYRGRTPRNATMFGPAGRVYVYRSYGVHWCMNFVCAEEGVADAVLLRALEPTRGLDAMRRRRGVGSDRLLCAGPGRVCEALAVTGQHDGMRLDRKPFAVYPRANEPEIVTAPRIGITKAAERRWRYALAASPYLSRRIKHMP